MRNLMKGSNNNNNKRNGTHPILLKKNTGDNTQYIGYTLTYGGQQTGIDGDSVYKRRNYSKIEICLCHVPDAVLQHNFECNLGMQGWKMIAAFNQRNGNSGV